MRRPIRLSALALLSAAGIALGTGLAPPEKVPAPEKASPAAAPATGVSVEPLPLFRGDAERIAPHLGFASTACLKADPHGKKVPFFVELVFWENGSVVSRDRITGSKFDKETEFTFSLKEEQATPGQKNPAAQGDGDGPTYRARVAFPGVAANSSFKRPARKGDDQGPVYQSGGQKEVIPEGRSVAFWAMYGGEGVKLVNSKESLEDKAKRVGWAVVLQVCLRDWNQEPRDDIKK